VPAREEGSADRDPGSGVDEEQGADHVDAVEVVEPQIEMDRARRADEKRRSPRCGVNGGARCPGGPTPGGEIDVLRHPQRLRIAAHRGLS